MNSLPFSSYQDQRSKFQERALYVVEPSVWMHYLGCWDQLIIVRLFMSHVFVYIFFHIFVAILCVLLIFVLPLASARYKSDNDFLSIN